MSIKVMAHVWGMDLVPHEKIVLLALADCADDDGYCWPSQETLGVKCSMHPGTVRRHIATLRERGILSTEVRMRSHGRGRSSNGYWITTNRADCAVGQPGPTAQSDDQPRTPAHDQPRTPARANRGTVSRTVSREPSVAPAAQNRDVVWDAVMAVCGVTEVTPSARGAYNKAVADLKSVGARPVDIGLHALAFRRRWPDASLTPTALARRWGETDPHMQHPTVDPKADAVSAAVHATHARLEAEKELDR